MDLQFSKEDEFFREEVRTWLEDNLQGKFAQLKGRGGPGDEDELIDERRAWEKLLGEAGWACVAWPKEHGGKSATLNQEVIFNEEYARSKAPGRLGHIGTELLGPTLIHFGNEEQKKRFLPGIVNASELWCQGYSEPNAGSDLANVQTQAVLDGDEWVINGQKVWTSHAHVAQWCFVLCRTDTDAPKHKGISYILVPMNQDGVEYRPIRQMTGNSEFSEVFFTDARTPKENVVGGINAGWKVAMGTLAFERGASTLGQQLAFNSEMDLILEAARETGAGKNPLIRQKLAALKVELNIMRLNSLRTLSHSETNELGREAMINKLYWSNLHRRMGEVAMDILGQEGLVRPETEGYDLHKLQRLFLFSRADTIYAGSNQIQRNIIGERALGLPREPKVSTKT
jgi:alkylation response protein AidB-like acyl-CoA dehydrogenase